MASLGTCVQVFVSSDKDDNSFQGYFGLMPWLALPYKQRSVKEKLAKKFGVTVRVSDFLQRQPTFHVDSLRKRCLFD